MNQNDPDFIEQLALTIHDRILNMETTLKDEGIMLPQFFEEVVNLSRICREFFDYDNSSALLEALKRIGFEASWCTVLEEPLTPLGLVCMGFQPRVEVPYDYLFIRLYKGVSNGSL